MKKTIAATKSTTSAQKGPPSKHTSSIQKPKGSTISPAGGGEESSLMPKAKFKIVDMMR
jgi:hypothetical protein